MNTTFRQGLVLFFVIAMYAIGINIWNSHNLNCYNFQTVPGEILVYVENCHPTFKQLCKGELGVRAIDEITENVYGVSYAIDPEEFDNWYLLKMDNPNINVAKVIADVEYNFSKFGSGSKIKIIPNVKMYAQTCAYTNSKYEPSWVYTNTVSKNHNVTESVSGTNLTQKCNFAFLYDVQGIKLPLYEFVTFEKFPNDPLLEKQYQHQIGTDTQKYWDEYSNVKGNEVLCYIIDQGMECGKPDSEDKGHPDLYSNMFEYEDTFGYDFVTGNNDPRNKKDYEMHGTHVGGIVSAVVNNGEGVAGFTNQVKLRSYRVLGENGSGTLFTIARGIKSAADEAEKINLARPVNHRTEINGVINMSLGCSCKVPRFIVKPMEEACKYAFDKKVFIVAAAGNEGNPRNPSSGDSAGYPARFETVLGVAATAWYDGKECRAWFSNTGDGVDCAAPGAGKFKDPRADGILSCFPGKTYKMCCGTSMASPFAAGLASTVISHNPNIKMCQLRQALTSSGDEVPSTGHIGRRVNVYKAVKAAEKLVKQSNDTFKNKINSSNFPRYDIMKPTRDLRDFRKKLYIGDVQHYGHYKLPNQFGTYTIILEK